MEVKKRSSKAIPLLVSIIVILVGCIGWYVWQTESKLKNQAANTHAQKPTDKEESPKQTDYKNAELGFSLKYPAEWGRAVLVNGPLLKYQKGEYKHLSFSKATNISVNFVTGAYSSPLDACGYDDAVQNAQHEQNAKQASVIGWEADSIKRYLTGQGFSGPTVDKESKTPGTTGPGWTEVTKDKSVLGYKDIDNPANRVVASDTNEICDPITQAHADEANAFINFYHYAVNYSNKSILGVNGQYDARKGDEASIRGQLVGVLNSIK